MPTRPHLPGGNDAQAIQRPTVEYVTARALAESDTLAEVTPKVLQAICEALGWEHGALWNVDVGAKLLRCVETWHLPSASFPEFEAVSRTTTFAPGVGLPGRVWSTGQPAWIQDVVKDTNFPRAPIAAREGLHAAFGFPVLLGPRVLGVMEFFSSEIRRPDEPLLQMLTTVGSQLGQFIERKRAQEEHAERLTRLVDELDAARRRAEEAMEVRGQFLATMSHEIRTPLNAIIGMTELAMGARLSPEVRGYLEPVARSADALLAIISDILDFSKMEARKMDLDRSPFGLRETVEETVHVLGPRAQAKGLELATDIVRDVPDALVGDAGRLRQVILNLVGNAIKFTHRGEIILRIAPELVDADRAQLHFAVSDTGPGIPPDTQARIFEPFRQADSSITRTHGGTGLGLAIASRLVELMGGRLWVESEVGVGSTFHFTPRFDRQAAGSGERWLTPPVSLRSLRVLVADDHATVRRIVEGMVTSWSMRPTSAAGGPAALAALEQARRIGSPFPIVIAGAQMAGLTGLALARRIARDRRHAGTQMIILTSMRGLPAALRARTPAVAGYVTTPVKHSDLLDALVMLVTKRQAGSAKPRRAPMPERRRGRALRILVAEDNAVNRTLVRKILEKRGHTVVAVENGKAAVDGFAGSFEKRRRFDVVIMDVQMPVMDGLEAASEIRQRETGLGGRVPIVALTAHAMAGDRERCLDAGMTAYLVKPLQPHQLIETVESLAQAAPAQPRSAEGVRFHGQTREAADSAPIDEADALAIAGGDPALVRELARIFFSELPKKLAAVRRAAAAGDSEQLRQAAHALKGSTSAIGARAAADASRRLESLGHSGNLEPAREALGDLEATLEQLASRLRQGSGGQARARQGGGGQKQRSRSTGPRSTAGPSRRTRSARKRR
jgi:two-component system, sensor histidine kinase and response regulator